MLFTNLEVSDVFLFNVLIAFGHLCINLGCIGMWLGDTREVRSVFQRVCEPCVIGPNPSVSSSVGTAERGGVWNVEYEDGQVEDVRQHL